MRPKTELTVQLTGKDSNVYNLYGIVGNALTNNNHQDLRDQMWAELETTDSYDAALANLRNYVHVE